MCTRADDRRPRPYVHVHTIQDLAERLYVTTVRLHLLDIMMAGMRCCRAINDSMVIWAAQVPKPP